MRAPSLVPLVVLGLLLHGPFAAAGPRTFDRLTYTAPEGWSVEETNRGHVQLSRTGPDSYCLVAIYASTPATGDLAASFASEWQGVALRTIDAVAAPAATLSDLGNTRAAMGAAQSTIKGSPAVAILVVLDAGSQVVSVLIVTPSMEAFSAYEADVKGLLAGLAVTRAETGAPAPPPQEEGGRLVIPPPTRPITVADLAGEWKHEDRISTTYVDRYSGSYAGSDHLAFRDTWTITAKGGITSDFFAIRNGKKLVEKTHGTIGAAGHVIDVRMGSPAKYVVRGWLDLPAMTILKICGPFYGGEVPRDVLENPEKGGNLNQTWVRHKPRSSKPD